MNEHFSSTQPLNPSSNFAAAATTDAANETPLPFTGDRRKEALRIANQLFHQSPDWVTFFREVLGVGGIVRRLFSDSKDMLEFEKSAEYAEIQTMVTQLREKTDGGANDREPTRVITVRLPASLHESLRAEAHDRQTSMNKLCITKLLQVIEEQLLAEHAGNASNATNE